MNILSLIQPSEMGADFKLEGGVWKVNFPTADTPPPPISNDARNTITNTPEGMFVDKRDRVAYALVQDNDTQKIRLYEYPADTIFDQLTATLVSEIDMLAMNGQFDDIAIDEGVITFTDVQTGLTLTLNTNELQRVGSLVSSDNVVVTETAGILRLTAKIDPNANNFLEIGVGGLKVTKSKVETKVTEKLTTKKTHVQSMSVVDDYTIGHVVGDQTLEIPKVRLQDTAGNLLALMNDPNTLVKST